MRLSFTSTLLFPFHVLATGIRGTVPYTALINTAIVSCALWGQKFIIQSFAALAFDYEQHKQSLIVISRLLSSACWIPAVPFLVTTAILGACFTYRDGATSLFPLLKATPSHVRVVSYTLLLALRSIFLRFIPALTMLVIYFFFARTLEDKGVERLYAYATIGVLGINLWNTFPLLIAPVLSVAGGLSPLQAVMLCSQIVRSNTIRFGALIILSALALVLINVSSFRLLDLHRLERMVLSISLIWISLTIATAMCLEAISRALEGGSHAYTYPMNESIKENQPSPGDVQVIVARAWVNDSAKK